MMMEAWVSERRKVTVDNDQLISLIKQREKQYLYQHADGYDDVVERDGKYVCVYYGTGNHIYSHNRYGPEVPRKMYDDLEIFKSMIALLEQEERSD